MNVKRGCHATVYLDEHVFVFGGVNYTDKALRKSERYDMQLNKWELLPHMRDARKNASACVLSKVLVYVFGGTNNFDSLDTIERLNVRDNYWELLQAQLPGLLSFVVPFKFSKFEILLFGGSVKEPGRDGRSFKTNGVFKLDAIRETVTEVMPMEKEVLSIYPAFYD